jgi:P-aminobenzoate N-oxygenase AurF
VTESAAPSSNRLESTTLRLTARSVRAAAGRRGGFEWPAQPAPDRLAMSTALLPLAGHPSFGDLTDEQVRRVALLEAVNFFSLNIHGEHELITGLAARLPGAAPPYIAQYLRHFLEEEQAHTAVFTRFCRQYTTGIFRDRQISFPRQFAPGEADFLFFACVVIFEEIAHFYNLQLASDDSLWLLARDINRYHAEDEAGHIAFGRLYVAEMWDRYGAQLDKEQKREAAGYLARYIQTVQRSYVNADVYRDCGLAAQVRDEILQSPHWQGIAEQSSRSVSRWLRSIGLGER